MNEPPKSLPRRIVEATVIGIFAFVFLIMMVQNQIEVHADRVLSVDYGIQQNSYLSRRCLYVWFVNALICKVKKNPTHFTKDDGY